MAKKLNKTEQHKKAVLQALEQTLGIVSQACKIAKIGRTQYYLWIKEDDEFAKQVNEIDDITLDFAESQLHKQINQGNTTATIFFLKTKGKKRGYIEKNEIEIIKEEVDLSGISDEDLRKYIDRQGLE
tara:strand:+ start:4850 stop:5233 length:384 start_codon:yes stop_codon:yes gene_type:complete